MNNRNSSILLNVIIVLTVFVVGVLSGPFIRGTESPSSLYMVQNRSFLDGEGIDYGLLGEAQRKITQNYIDADTIDYDNLTQGSVQGLVSAIGNKYNEYLTTEDLEAYQNRNDSSFEGIGTTLIYNGEYTLIESPIDGYPAQDAGLMSGDYILEVDGEDMFKKNAHYVSSKIIGEAGTKVNLKMYRESNAEMFETEITRAIVDLENVRYEYLEDGIYLIKVIKFTEGTLEEFYSNWNTIVKDILGNQANPSIKGVVLDLRNNPGGFVQGAIHVASEFFPKGTMVLAEVDRDGKKAEKRTNKIPLLEDIPLVVLVNEGTASASEIVAGAVQDHGRGLLVGKPTLGKGVEQTLIDLSDGSVLKLVIRKWLTPDGNNLSNENSITPDISIEYEREIESSKYDTQMLRALEEIKKSL